MTAALHLGRGARGEDEQRSELLVRCLEPALGLHADVPEPLPVGAAQHDREIAIEPILRHQRIPGEALAHPIREGDHVALERERARRACERELDALSERVRGARPRRERAAPDRKSTRLNSSHLVISYAVFCLKKKKHTHSYHPRITRYFTMP